MRVMSRIDRQGFFLEDVVPRGDQPLPEDAIESRPPEGFYAPKWTGSEWIEGTDATSLLASHKETKEQELRNAADAWYRENIRSFEGAVVVAKYGRGGLTALSTEERAVFDSMNANYTKLKGLVSAVRVATSVAEVKGITW